MAIRTMVNLAAPGMAIDRRVESALSGIVLSLSKDRRKREETFSSSATPCLGNANLMFRQPYGSGERPPSAGLGRRSCRAPARKALDEDPTLSVRSGWPLGPDVLHRTGQV
jgi:hypothetical protein